MADTYDRPGVRVQEKFISGQSTPLVPILQGCVVGHSYQIEEDVAVAKLDATDNVQNVVAGSEDEAPAECDLAYLLRSGGVTKVLDEGVDALGDPIVLSISSSASPEVVVVSGVPTWAEDASVIRTVDDGWAAAIADRLVVTSGSGYTEPRAFAIKSVSTENDIYTITIATTSVPLINCTEAQYKIIRPYMEDATLGTDLEDKAETWWSYVGTTTPAGSGEVKEVYYGVVGAGDIVRFWSTETATVYPNDYEYYFEISSVGAYETEEGSGEWVPYIVFDDDDLLGLINCPGTRTFDYTIYKQAFIPIIFPFPNLESESSFDTGTDMDLLRYRDNVTNITVPTSDDLTIVNPILKLRSNVSTKYFPISSYDILTTETGVKKIAIFNKIEVDDIRVSEKFAYTTSADNPILEEGGGKHVYFYDSNADFITSGVTQNDILEIVDAGGLNDGEKTLFGDATSPRTQTPVFAVINKNTLDLQFPCRVSVPLASSGKVKYRIISEEFDEGDILCSYRALRKSHTTRLVLAGSLAELEALIPPVAPENPLAWGMYKAITASGGLQVAGIMVDEINEITHYDTTVEARSEYSVSTNVVEEGTSAAFSRAFEYLKLEDVYALAILSHQPTVHQLAYAHVVAMSAPEKKKERITIVSPLLNKTDVRVDVQSDTGDSAGRVDLSGSEYVQFGVDSDNEDSINFIDSNVRGGDYLQILSGRASNGANLAGCYKIDSVSSKYVLVDDQKEFGGVSRIIESVKQYDIKWRIIKRVYAKTEQAAAVAAYANAYTSGVDADGDPGYDDRRLVVYWPDVMKIDDDGTVKKMDGWYGACGVAGMCGLAANQGFTNLPMLGFAGVVHSNDHFTDEDLDIMAAGGVYIVIDDNGVVVCRHQSTAAVDLVTTRELSIVRVVDWIAKIMRNTAKPFIGRWNITEVLKGLIATKLQGVINYAVDRGIILGGAVTSIETDPDAPDSLLISLAIDPPYPCNRIYITINV